MESFRPLYFARFDEKSDIWNFVPHAHDCFEMLYMDEDAQIRFTKVLLPDEMPREIELFASRK